MVVQQAIKLCFRFICSGSNKLLQTFGVLMFVAGSAQAASIVANPGSANPGSVYTGAQDITAAFDLSYSADIGDMTSNTSTTAGHVTIDAMAGNVSGYNWYSFTILENLADPAALSTVVLDVDYGRGANGNDPGSVDLLIGLYDSIGDVVMSNNNALLIYGQDGSIADQDSYIETTLAAGTYYIAVGSTGTKFADNWSISGNANSQLELGDTYMLQVSIPIPAAVWLFGSALGFLGWMRRRA
jgi:hypothetical protein